MRASYDPEVDAAYIYLKDSPGAGESRRQVTCGNDPGHDIVLDLDAEGILLGIEVLNATKRLPKELLDSVKRQKSNRELFNGSESGR